MNEKLFPAILIILDLAAAIVYATKGDWPRVGYWLAAGVLTYCIIIAK